jgi:pyruvate ferredoxin oxidoreductase gamma subunit
MLGAVYQVRFHGRGGQGVVTAAELLSIAAFEEGRHAQAFPTFGSERSGAPVVSYCRIDDAPIRSREPVLDPDALVIQDVTLLQMHGLFAGLKAGGCVLINSSLPAEKLAGAPDHALTVPGSELAREHFGRPMPNAALLGGLCAAEGVVSLDALSAAIREKLPAAVAEPNVAAAAAAHAHVQAELEEAARC